MKNRIAILTFSFFLGLLPFVTASAQVGDIIRDIVRLRVELEKTDLLLERAEELANSVDNPVVDGFVDRAKETQANAWQNFNLRTEAGYRLAYQLTLQARSLAKSALDNGRRDDTFEGGVLNRLERVQELLDRFRDRLSEQNQDRPGLESLYESSRERLTRAWEFYRKGEFRPALKLAEQVEDGLARLLRQAGDNNRDRGQYDRRADAAREAVDQARASLTGCSSDLAEQMVADAEAALRQADELNAAGRPGLALKSLHRARDMAQRALQECDSEGDLGQRYDRIKSAADRLAESISGQTDPKAEDIRSLLQQVYDQLERAKTMMDSNQSNSALVALKAAQLTLRQAEDLSRP